MKIEAFEKLGARFVPTRKETAPSEKRLVYGIVLEPETTDSQGEIYSADVIEKAAHDFMADYQNLGEMHRALINEGAEIVESWIAPVDLEINGETVKSGTWLMGIRVKSDHLWQKVKTGELTGLSIGGFAERQELGPT